MDRICISFSSSSSYTYMGKIERYLGKETHHIGRECSILRRIPNSCFEYQYPDVARRKSPTGNWWRRIDHLSQYLHQ